MRFCLGKLCPYIVVFLLQIIDLRSECSDCGIFVVSLSAICINLTLSFSKLTFEAVYFIVKLVNNSVVLFGVFLENCLLTEGVTKFRFHAYKILPQIEHLFFKVSLFFLSVIQCVFQIVVSLLSVYEILLSVFFLFLSLLKIFL